MEVYSPFLPKIFFLRNMFDFKDSAQKFCKGFGGVSSIECHIILSLKDNDKFNVLKVTLLLFRKKSPRYE